MKIAVVTLCIALVAVMLAEHYPRRLWNKIHPKPVPAYNYRANLFFNRDSSLQAALPSTGRIVFLGDSYFKTEWGELLQRTDVAGRAINGDVTRGMLARLPRIIESRPVLLLIEGGSNDIDHGIAAGEAYRNLKAIASECAKTSTPVIFFTVPRIGYKSPKNAAIDSLNTLLLQDRSVQVFDLCKLMQNIGPAAYQADSVHMSPVGYSRLADTLQKIIDTRNNTIAN